MLRNSFAAAQKAPFLRRNGASTGDVNLIDASQSNGYSLPWRSSGDDEDLLGIEFDADNDFRLGNSYQKPLRTVIEFPLLANASLATQTFFVAPKAMVITGISEIHSTAGSDSGAVTLAITHETGVQAKGTGVSVMSGTFNMKGTANTVQNATLAAKYQKQTSNNTPVMGGAGIIVLKAGDRLSAKFTGTLTALAGVVVSVFSAPGGKYPYAQYVSNAVAGQATAPIFTALRPMQVAGVVCICGAPETASGTWVLDVTKDTGTTAPGGGTSVLAATVNLKTIVANTTTTPALAASTATLQLAAGDRLSVKFSGSATPAALAGMVVVVYFTPVKEKQFALFSLLTAPGSNQAFFTADRDYIVEDIAGSWSVVAGTGGRVSVEIDTGTTAPGSGTSLLTDNSNAGFDTTGTINTVNYGTLAALHLRYLRAGDRLATKVAGTQASFAGLQLAVLLSAV